MFVGDITNLKIAALDTLTPKPGALTAKLFDAVAPRDAAFDASRDELYVSAKTQVNIYGNASKLDGAIKSTRVIIPDIIGMNSGMSSIPRLILDKAHDRLYVAFYAANSSGIAVFEQASKLNGTVAPARIIRGVSDLINFVIDPTRNLLYSCPGHLVPGTISVVEKIDTINGDVRSQRTIRTQYGVKSMALDTVRDRLYMAADRGRSMANGGSVLILDGASTASGAVSPTTLIMPSQSYGSAIALDVQNDRLYAGFLSEAFVLEGASKLNATTSMALAVAIKGPEDTYISFFAVPQ